MFEQAWAKSGPSGKVKKEIKKQVEAHREALLVEWEAKVDVSSPRPER